MDKIKKILVVCTGNSCRSPMAEGFLKKELKQEDGFEIVSAGTSAMEGLSPTQPAIDVMKEEAIDISAYRSKPFSKDLIESSGLILAMANMHREFILNIMPEVRNKIYLYKEFAGGENQDIEDPIGKPLAVYKNVKEEIKKSTEGIVNKIKEEGVK